MHVYTYGTLMFPDVWRSVVGKDFPTVAGTANGFAVYRVRDAVFPGIIAAADAMVRGIVYLDVDDYSLARLDRFEDDFYERQALSVDCDDGQQRTAEAYVVTLPNRNVLTSEPWDGESFVASGGLEHFKSRFAGFGRIAGKNIVGND
jgi:gamma-glutamylcyclotransferase (GGCT)/AIG2-like uncharacterized protein YtfP